MGFTCSSRLPTRDKVPIAPNRVASHIVATPRELRDRNHTTKVKQELKIPKSACPPTSQYCDEFSPEEIISAILDKYRKIEATRELEKWFSERCEEIKQCEKVYDYHNMYRKTKELTTKKSYNILSKGLCDDNGNLQLDPDQIVRIWETYVEQLFNNDRPSLYTLSNDDTGPSILKSEVENAINDLKNKKRPGNDNVYGEVLKMLCETNSQFLDSLVRQKAMAQCKENRSVLPRANSLYQEHFNLTNARRGKWDSDLPQKGHEIASTYQKPSDFKLTRNTWTTLNRIRTSSGICADSLYKWVKALTPECDCRAQRKTVPHIVEECLRRRFHGVFDEFLNATENPKHTKKREALLSIQVLIQRAKGVNTDVFTCFIDFEKAFDKVQHERFIETWRITNIDDKDIRIITNLYRKQVAKIRVDNQLSDEVQCQEEYDKTALVPERDRVHAKIAECQWELGSTVDELTNVKNGYITPETGRQVLCVHRKLGILDHNGDIVPYEYLRHVQAVTLDKGRQIQFLGCSRPQGENAEIKAINFDRCFQSILQIMGRD
ncbi:unnamed protein product [Diabrotica balteata]|uniref:Reverse transcriptase domain-containing protein n=1 Tax=Diabrotica balteata TaxID=107213 RepID=A0A9N9SNW0_DIABA|nr:unnamed protein product [Diabrotica balteata]